MYNIYVMYIPSLMGGQWSPLRHKCPNEQKISQQISRWWVLGCQKNTLLWRPSLSAHLSPTNNTTLCNALFNCYFLHFSGTSSHNPSRDAVGALHLRVLVSTHSSITIYRTIYCPVISLYYRFTYTMHLFNIWP